jgi:hypothetical protein
MIECLLQHSLLDTAAGADHMARSAVLLSKADSARDDVSEASGLDASTKQSMVQRLLLPAVRSNAEAAKAVVQQSMDPAGALVCSALVDALLENDAADLNQRRTEVQHLMVSIAAMHMQQQGATEHARLALRNAAFVVVAAALAVSLAMLGLLPVVGAILVMLILT